MPSEATSDSPAKQAQSLPHSSLSLYGGLWTRMLMFWLRLLPAWLCERLALPVSGVFYLLAGQQRRAIHGNLLALHPEDGPLIAWLRGGRVFHQFALTYLDRLWHLHFGKALKWDPVGEANLVKLRHEPGGALIFTIHAGNYDIGSTLFAEHLGRELHIVRVAEREESLQKLREAELSRIHPLLRVHYNLPDAHLGLLLCNLLRAGQVVAVQGDRVVLEVSPVMATHENVMFKLPRGPLVLAEMTRMPCYPIILHRLGRLLYRVEIFPALCQRGERVSLDELSARWLAVLHPFLERHWDQWFVFEPLLTRAS